MNPDDLRKWVEATDGDACKDDTADVNFIDKRPPSQLWLPVVLMASHLEEMLHALMDAPDADVSAIAADLMCVADAFPKEVEALVIKK